MPDPIKILTIGPPDGSISSLVAKVGAINARHGPFAALFVLGDFFAPAHADVTDAVRAEEEALLSGEIALPMPTYILHPPSPLSTSLQTRILSTDVREDGTRQLAEQLFYLGKSGVCRIGGKEGQEGLNVAYVGGAWDAQRWAAESEESPDELSTSHITRASIASLLAHPSFKAPVAVSSSSAAPTTLAAARAAAAAAAAAEASSSASATAPPIDLLLTNVWASSITLFSSADALPDPTSRTWGTPALMPVYRLSRSRYIFSLAPGPLPHSTDDGVIGLSPAIRTRGTFWERAPFRTEAGSDAANTSSRFISLARFANAEKARWFYALSLVPASSMDAAQKKAASVAPKNVTPSPFAVTPAVKREGEALDSGANYRWAGEPTKGKRPKRDPGTGANSIGASGEERASGSSDRKRRPAAAPVAPSDCWFCLSNEQCAKHLVVSIGTECYIALPKGQLIDSGAEGNLVPGGGHVLIIPITHVPSPLSLSPTLAAPLLSEMSAWRSALRATYATFGCAFVGWEICRSQGTRVGHMQAQALPVAASLAPKLEQWFRAKAEEEGYQFVPDDEVEERLKAGTDEQEQLARSDYFRLDLPNKTLLVDLNDPSVRFSLQFPRQALAQLLDVPSRADWRVCARSEAVERAEKEAFASVFEEAASKVVGDD